MRWDFSMWGVVASAVLVGCGERAAVDAYAVSDSAGVQIVESAAPSWSVAEAWRLASESSTVIGDGANDQLFEVVGVDRLSTGEIVVANGGSQEVRIYSLDGELREVFGGRGEGPGEFTSLSAVQVTPGDTIIALNQVPLRVSRFTLADGLLQDRALGHDRETRWIDAYPAGLLGSSHLLVYGYPDYLAPRFGDGYYHEPLPWGLLDLANGEVDEGGEFPGYEMMLEHSGRGVRALPIPFSHTGDIAVAGSSVLIVPNDAFRILKYRRDGSLEAEWRYLKPARAVTAVDVREWVDRRIATFGDRSDPRVAEAARVLEALPPAESVPLISGVEADVLGNTWVREFQWPPSDFISFVAFDHEGRLLGQIRVPEGLDGASGPESKPLRIGRDFLLGVWKSELDVETVRLYPLVRPVT